MPVTYYNEIDPYAAQWLRNLIKKGLIADGEVDTRSIVDVSPDDVRGFTQAHFFAGIGGWSHALRLSRWPDHRKIWTGSCPCQPFSVAGKGDGVNDPRHLWPHFFRLIAAVRPPVVMGEQVAGAAGYGWLDGVRADLEAEGYASRGVDIPACAVDAPHIRSRLYWVASYVANANHERRNGVHPLLRADAGRCNAEKIYETAGRGSGDVADATHVRREEWERQNRQQDAGSRRQSRVDVAGNSSFWSGAVWLTGSDGKARRAPPGVPLLAYGIPNRVGKLRAYGNAIVPPLAAEVIKAYMDVQP